MTRALRVLHRPRILIVNCYLDETRSSIGRATKVPQGMGPAYLAGALSPERCEIRLYSELASGPLEDEQLLAWPDMLVLTGLTTALDRMRHLSAYARTKNPRVVVVAGGHAVRALPRYCEQFFDYCCLGDVEELRDVVTDVFGPGFAADVMTPRFDLAPWLGYVGYLESSRNCNFRCSFCVMTAENRRYQIYEIDDLRRQLVAMGKRDMLVFIDQNFFGNDRRRFLARLDVLREFKRDGWFKGWAALVTGDFFRQEENLRLAADAGCVGLFSGVESFDLEWLEKSNKRQNAQLDPVEVSRRTLEAGMIFTYGLVFDLTTRRIADIHRELDGILRCPELTLPAYVSTSLPMLNTPFFHDCLREGLLLPNTRIRDLDSTTLSVQPLDGIDAAASFLRDLQTMRGYRGRVLRHLAEFTWRYRRDLNPLVLGFALAHAPLLCAPVLAASPTRLRKLRPRRTHVSTTERLDDCYQPAFPVDSRYANHFEPTLLTDSNGGLCEEVARDLEETGPQLRVSNA